MDTKETDGRKAEAFTHALTLRHGDRVRVDSPRYRGPGIVTNQTHWESHVVCLWASAEPHVAVLLENGNTWFYPALDVRVAD
jgi:hypothetical protein